MPSITRPARQTDYALVPRECPLVIDNGSFSFRIGWAGEVEPRLVFRNGVHKLRHKASGETVNVIGDFDHGLMKFFESGRSNFRSAFDGNVVYQFEYMEYILDYAFERMGAEGLQIEELFAADLYLKSSVLIVVGIFGISCGISFSLEAGRQFVLGL